MEAETGRGNIEKPRQMANIIICRTDVTTFHEAHPRLVSAKGDSDIVLGETCFFPETAQGATCACFAFFHGSNIIILPTALSFLPESW